VTLGLPLLDALGGGRARAADEAVDPYAIFFRQANGVAAAQNTSELGQEPERFWPKEVGPLTVDSVQGRALDELSDYLDRLLVVGNVNMSNFDYGDGHARGAMQGLTARGPVVAGVGGDSEAAGESLDHRIGRELNADGRESLFLYAGQNGGWLGGPCISYRGPGNRRAAIHDPLNAYQQIMGLDSEQFAELIARQRSVNDFVREQMNALLTRPELSTDDVRRLELHQASIRDLENTLTCNLAADQEMALAGLSAGYDSTDGGLVLQAARAHMHVAALAVACGYTRAVALQIGSGNDGSTRYPDPNSGSLMENYHYISHRRLSHDSSGAVIAGSDLLHHKIDRHFAETFRYLLDRLSEYTMPNGANLLDCGVCVWFNDNGNGPGHSARNVPFILAGGANGFLVQGQFVQAAGGQSEDNHNRVLNTIGSAVGLRNASGELLDDFGDSGLAHGTIDEMIA
jgi:hypothetical protein